jgi:Cys-tRNA(Pro) deacylase
MNSVALGASGLQVTPICLGTMTFGEQVNEASAHTILDRSLERGVNFIDAAEMYSVPAKAETCGATETIIGNWFAKHPGAREKLVVATKVAGPARGMPWMRPEVSKAGIIEACEGSLRRLQTDVIDLYQIHWPARNVPVFGAVYFDPAKDKPMPSVLEQLEALSGLVQAGKVRAVGLSNESPYGVHEFVRLAEQHGLPRVATVQNPYCLINRTYENGLDETCHRLGVSLLAYSPLGFGLLSGKYDETGLVGDHGRMAIYDSMKAQRWGRPEALAAAKRYNTLARDHGMTPSQLALAFCYRNPKVASTIIGVTSLAQLDECLDAWDTQLSPELLKAIDAIRWELRDPAQGGRHPRRAARDPLQGAMRVARRSRFHGILSPTLSSLHLFMAKKTHISETPATAWLKAHGVTFTEHPYEYLEHGGAQHSAAVLGFDPFAVVKTLIMQDEAAKPLAILMHGNRTVSTKNLARQIGAKSVEPCKPEVANRHSGYLVGGTSPFGLKREMPVYVESTVLALPKIWINGGRRGFLVGIDPAVLAAPLGAKPVQCALAE